MGQGGRDRWRHGDLDPLAVTELADVEIDEQADAAGRAFFDVRGRSQRAALWRLAG
jgi:hypothetical protein